MITSIYMGDYEDYKKPVMVPLSAYLDKKDGKFYCRLCYINTQEDPLPKEVSDKLTPFLEKMETDKGSESTKYLCGLSGISGKCPYTEILRKPMEEKVNKV